TLQKKLPKDVYLDIGYVGSKGTNLTMTYDGNRPLAIVTPGPGVASIASRRPFQGFDNISTTKSVGNSSYHSLQVKTERRVDSGQRTRNLWFNTSAFALPVPGRFGNSARNQIHLPGLNQVDTSATKNFRFAERHQVQFRAEFFNFFNHVNLGSPGLNIRDVANFGRVTSTVQGAAGMPGDARVVQFGAKYSF